jgi:hypothetical protein
VWADGIYLGARLEKDEQLPAHYRGEGLTANEELLGDGDQLPGIEGQLGDVLRNLHDLGLSAPPLAIGDGNLWIWGGEGVPDHPPPELLESPHPEFR